MKLWVFFYTDFSAIAGTRFLPEKNGG